MFLYSKLVLKAKPVISDLFLGQQVVAESEQMRKEADDTGPKAELEHWRLRMAKFNSLLEQIKGFECRTIIGILQAARSRVLKVKPKTVSSISLPA